MNCQRLASLSRSPLLQQGLFASLALTVTLVGGQQYLRWNQPPEPLLPSRTPVATQTHFSVASSRPIEQVRFRLMSTDQVETAQQLPREERWVF